jgi:hypothetical protein
LKDGLERIFQIMLKNVKCQYPVWGWGGEREMLVIRVIGVVVNNACEFNYVSFKFS